MNLSLLFSLIVFALLDVVRSEYARAYGNEAKDSLGYVALIASSLILIFLAFPPWE